MWIKTYNVEQETCNIKAINMTLHMQLWRIIIYLRLHKKSFAFCWYIWLDEELGIVNRLLWRRICAALRWINMQFCLWIIYALYIIFIFVSLELVGCTSDCLNWHPIFYTTCCCIPAVCYIKVIFTFLVVLRTWSGIL